MCGISCWVSKNDISEKNFEIFNNAVSHRGPDSSSVKFYKFDKTNLALGHRRLSIIDLSKDANQPMNFESYEIIFNGEIYNYLELKSELESRGIKFETKSDTEVLLKAYKEWGSDCLDKFNGMFSFLIYDFEKNQIFFARDRFGIKPLYYYKDRESIYFASEIKQFTKIENFEPVGNVNTIGNFIDNRYLDYSEETFFKDIYQVRGGEAGYVNLHNLEFKKYKWYDLTKTEYHKSVSFLELFKKSINLRLRSDVMVGSCLSGGIDSSSIVCVVDKNLSVNKNNHTFQTFTSCFEDKNYDERDLVEVTRKKTSINSNYVFPSGKDFFEDLNNIIYFQDEPFPSTSIYAQSCVFKQANQKGIKVMLDGQGADEIFCGYSEIFYPSYFKSLNFKEKIYEILNSSNKKKMIRFFFKSLFIKKNKKKASLLKRKYINKFQDDFDSLKSHTIYFMKYHLPALLHYEDRNSMRYSIEARLPFLDYKLVEAGYNMSDQDKLRDGLGKIIIRDSLRRIVPNEILDNKLKKGFGTPQKKWMFENKDKILNKIEMLFKYDIFNSKDLDLILQNFKTNLFNESLIMRLYTLSVWMNVFKINRIT